MKRKSVVVVCVLFASVLARANPPVFGTVLQRWSLQMSGSYAGSGMTWVRDSGKFFLMDQGYAGPCRVWKLDPADPQGTIESVPWTFADFGGPTTDIPWGIAWDNDSGCFWISQIIDGNIYGELYLLRYVWSGSRWVWGGTARDSWRIDSLAGLFWIAGMEKNPVDGAYYAHVFSTVQDTSGLGRFDPYTKSVLGLLPNGIGLQERGLTLVPWDSSYILTINWSASQYRKRDSTGLLLQSAQAAYAPSDWALYVPSVVRPEDTVCAYCINSHSNNYFERISVGMLWGQLPSALSHSVRPVEIVSPPGVVDSGQTVSPKLVVQNMSPDTAEDVDVHFAVDDPFERLVYHDSTTVTLLPMTSDTLQFQDWVPVGRGNMTAVAWTHWSEDSVPEDDTLERDFLVRVLDVAIVEVGGPVPGDTIDPGTVYPQVVLANHGNVASGRFPLTVNIGSYSDTLVLDYLLPGMHYPVTFLHPWTATAGIWYCTFNAQVPGDLRPGDNDTTFWFVVRGGIDYDVACEVILVPSGVIDTLPFTPQARYANYGVSDARCTTYCWIEDTTTDVVIYTDNAPVMLMAGGNAIVAYKPCTLTVEAPYMVSCSIHLATDQNWLNNAIHQPFRVGAGAEYDVLISEILAPSGIVDSSAVVLPRAEVFNAGLYTETFPVWFRLPGGYEQVRQFTLDAGMYDTVTFPMWRANVHLGGHSATAWTLLEGDMNPDNDTLVKPFTVRKRDLGVSAIFWPKDTVPDTTLVHPCCEVKNYGTTVETLQVLFNISLFEARETVFGLVGGATDTVVFSDTWMSSPGIWVSRAEVIPNPADPIPDNNVMIDTFWVLGTIEHEVAVECVIAPVGTLYVNEPIQPSFVARNLGAQSETFWGQFRLFDPESTRYYVDSLQVVDLAPGASKTLVFDTLVESLPVGRHKGWCSTGYDSSEYYFWILPGPGIEEYGSLPVRFALDQAEPSLFQSGTRIRFGLPMPSAVDLALFSADGVLVRTLRKGVLDAGYYRIAWNGKDDYGKACAPGVYYLRMTAADFFASHKLVKLE